MRISDKITRGMPRAGLILLEAGLVMAVLYLMVSFLKDKFPILRESLRWLLG